MAGHYSRDMFDACFFYPCKTYYLRMGGNMNDYVLSCCSTADLSKERFAERNIKVIYFHFMIGNEDYLDDCGESVAPKELFDRMGAGEVTKTSQVTAGERYAVEKTTGDIELAE